MSNNSYARGIDDHYTKIWSAPTRVIRWERGPFRELPEEFRILEVRRTSGMTAYGTRCMSQIKDESRLEIHAFCRSHDATNLVEILTVIAHYHRTGHQLGLGHAVNFGKPWVAGSSCAHGVLSRPYLDGPDLEWLANPRVQFLWLIPITEAEVALKKAQGMEALEERFEQAQFDFLDPSRKSTV